MSAEHQGMNQTRERPARAYNGYAMLALAVVLLAISAWRFVVFVHLAKQQIDFGPEIAVSIALVADTLIVEVIDNGKGGADPQNGTGLIGLASRVEALDGTLVISSPAGGPTTLKAEIPCE